MIVLNYYKFNKTRCGSTKLIIEKDYEGNDPRVYDIYNVVHQHLKEMFYRIPKMSDFLMYNDGLEFKLPPSDGKLVTAATIKKWMKELPFKTFVKRTSPHPHISYSYEYLITIEN